MIALALFGVAAATMTDFDLANLRSVRGDAPLPIVLVDTSGLRSPYLPPKLDEQRQAEDTGVRVKLRWRRIRLYVPFGPN